MHSTHASINCYCRPMMMDEPIVRQIVGDLRSELADAKADRLEADRRVRALTKLIEGYVDLFPSVAKPTDAPAIVGGGDIEIDEDKDRPRGQEAVRQVMEGSPGKWWTVGAMVWELDHRGWLPDSGTPANAVRTAMDRVVVSEAAVKKDRGKSGAVVYSYRPFEHGSNGSQPVPNDVATAEEAEEVAT